MEVSFRRFLTASPKRPSRPLLRSQRLRARPPVAVSLLRLRHPHLSLQLAQSCSQVPGSRNMLSQLRSWLGHGMLEQCEEEDADVPSTNEAYFLGRLYVYRLVALGTMMPSHLLIADAKARNSY